MDPLPDETGFRIQEAVRTPSDLLHFFKQNSFVVAKTGWERMCEVKGSRMVERLSETG